MKNIPQKYLNLLKVLIGLSVLTWVLSSIDYYELAGLMREGDTAYFITGISILLFTFFFIQITRFYYSIRKTAIGFMGAVRLFFIGFLFNNLIPTNIGGDAVRLYYLQNTTQTSWGEASGLLFIYRLSGLLVLFAAGCIYCIFYYDILLRETGNFLNFQPEQSLFFILIAGLLFLIFAAFIVKKYLWSKVSGFFEEAARAITAFKKYEYLIIIVLAALFHLGRMAGIYYLLLYFGADLYFIHLIFVLFLTAIVTLIPVSVGGIGIMEGALTGSLALYGVSLSAAAGVALLNRIVLIFIACIGAVFYMKMEKP